MYGDTEILKKIHAGDSHAQDYIIDKYKNLVKIKAHAYFIVGADREDIVQEGMIGLYKAIRDFKPDKQATFRAFADLCITRQIITAIKSANRQKNIPLNSYISLNKSIYDGDMEKGHIDLLADTGINNPEELLIGQEDKNYIEQHMLASLSVLECRVLALYLQGKSYVEISQIISKGEKSIDNALQRVRRKVEKILAERNLTHKRNYVNI